VTSLPDVDDPDEGVETPPELTASDYEEFVEYYDSAKVLTDSRISEVLESKEDILLKRRALEHATRGGKRVRPVVTILMGEIFDAPLDKTLNHASIVELVHNASLVADDVFDGSEQRRGSSTLWNVLGRLPFGGFGEKVATGATIMAENGLVALAFELVEDPDVARALGRGLRKLVDGFFQEGASVFDGVVTGGYDKYIEINRAKTGGLFALAAWMSATYTDAPDEQENAARKYGESLGILYQIADDIADEELPSYIQDPAAELEKWYDTTTGYIEDLPEHPSQAYLYTAPSWMVYKMLSQEDALDGIDVPFIPDLGAE